VVLNLLPFGLLGRVQGFQNTVALKDVLRPEVLIEENLPLWPSRALRTTGARAGRFTGAGLGTTGTGAATSTTGAGFGCYAFFETRLGDSVDATGMDVSDAAAIGFRYDFSWRTPHTQ